MSGAAGRDGAEQSLSGVDRWLSGIAGTTIAALGILAVFTTRSDVASSILTIVGGVFLLMAITGRAVVGLKVGDNEVVLAALAARNALRLGHEDEAYELLTEVTTGKSPAEWARGITPDKYEWHAMETIRALLPYGASIQARPGYEDFDFDGLIRLGDKRIVVEVYMGTLFTGRRLADVLGRILSTGERIDGLLVVVNGVPRTSGVDRIRKVTQQHKLQLEVVSWRPMDSPEPLKRAIDDLLGS